MDVQYFISVFKFAAILSALIYNALLIFILIVYPQTKQTPKNINLENNPPSTSSLRDGAHFSMKSKGRSRSCQSSVTRGAGSVNLDRRGLDADNRSIVDSEAGENLGRYRR